MYDYPKFRQNEMSKFREAKKKILNHLKSCIVVFINYQNIKYESKLDFQRSNSLTQIICNRTIIPFFHLLTIYVYRKDRIITLHSVVILCVCVCV